MGVQVALGLGRLISGAVLALFCALPAHAQSRFEGWQSTVLAADWRDSDGRTIEAFDNARRDLSAAFRSAGFPDDLHLSVTLNPQKPDHLSPVETLRRINDLAQQQTRGCLFYITTHGSPEKLVFGDTKGIEPVDLATMTRQWCGHRPTVLIISACFSGAFIDALRAPNRMILTAARRDRTSFGCGEGDTYPWFDACVLESLPEASDFLALARLTRACVSRRETEAEIDRPSEPQLFVGAEMQIRLPTLRFNTGL